MVLGSVLETFKIELVAHLSVKDYDEPKVPKINDRHNDRTIIRWSPILKECLSNSYGSRGLLSCVLREDFTVDYEVMGPLLAN